MNARSIVRRIHAKLPMASIFIEVPSCLLEGQEAPPSYEGNEGLRQLIDQGVWVEHLPNGTTARHMVSYFSYSEPLHHKMKTSPLMEVRYFTRHKDETRQWGTGIECFSEVEIAKGQYHHPSFMHPEVIDQLEVLMKWQKRDWFELLNKDFAKILIDADNYSSSGIYFYPNEMGKVIFRLRVRNDPNRIRQVASSLRRALRWARSNALPVKVTVTR